MTSTKHPEALRLVEQYDYGDPVAHSNTWKTAVCNELRRLHAENVALQQGYDAARLEIDHLRGATKSKLLAQPVAWMVYIPSIDTQHLYYSQEDMGYVDDVTNHADAEVTPLYEMAAPKAEVAPAGEYPSLPAKQALYVFKGKDGEREEVHGYDELQMWGLVDADRAMRAKAAPAAAAGQCEDAIELLGKYKELCEEIKRGDSYHIGRIDAAISVLAQAAPQPAVQPGAPVAWRSWDSENSRWNFTLWPDEWAGHADVWEPLYTYPAAPVAQGDALPRECIRILRRDLNKSTVLAALLRHGTYAARSQAKEGDPK